MTSRFASLSGGMIVRGTVPPELLFGTASARPTVREAPHPIADAIKPTADQPVPPAPFVASAANPAADDAPRKAVTVRLSPTQHRRLRLTCADLGRTGQSILMQALIDYLDRLHVATPAGDCPEAPRA